MLSNNKLSIRNALLGLGLLAAAQVSQAALITLDAGRFTASYDDAQAAQYGLGALSGSLDTVYFRPDELFAVSGGRPASTPATLQLTITIHPDYAFTGLSFAERGDYFVYGTGIVGADASLLAVNPGTSDAVILDLTPGVQFSQPDVSSPWELAGSLAAQGLDAPQTLLLTLDNTLFASAGANSLGFIQKTYVGFRIATEARPAAVPEPSSWALLLAGVLAALLAGRRHMRMPSGIRPGRRNRL